MTTKPSSAPWADGPHPLIPMPSKHTTDDHPCIEASSNMCQAHNAIIRGLNSILLQAPYVKSGPDAKSFTVYVTAWSKLVKHHYWVQEVHVFDQFEKIAAQSGLLDRFREQHRIVSAGVDRLAAYLQAAVPEQYDAKALLEIIDSFAQAFIDDMHAEVKFFKETNTYDREAQAKMWSDSLREAKQESNLGMMSDIVPVFMTNADLSYEGGETSPFPAALPYAVQYWFALGNEAWKFGSCDFFGKPRPLTQVAA